jgi:hypothetical protein
MGTLKGYGDVVAKFFADLTEIKVILFLAFQS